MRIIVFSLLTWLLGCSPKPAKAPAPLPEKPGATYPLVYPVLQVSDRDTRVSEDEESLTTTRVSAGMSWREMHIIDSSGSLYEVTRVTDFGRENAFLDMGTSSYRVFLDLTPPKKIALEQVKAYLIKVLQFQNQTGLFPDAVEVGTPKVQKCPSLTALIDMCRRTWEWDRRN
jgi:hypothetical protein